MTPAEPTPSGAMGDDESSVVSLLRRGGLAFSGGVVAGLAGLVLSVIVGRSYGTTGSGVFFSVVAVVTIISNIVELGADTGFVWQLPRLRATGRAGQQRRALRIGGVPVAVTAGVAALAVFLSAPWLGGALGDPALTVPGLQIGSVAVLGGTVATVAIAATRGFGYIMPFILLQNLILPIGRVLLILGIVIWSGSVVLAIGAWAIVWTLVGVAALLLVYRTARGLPEDHSAVSQGLRTEFWGYSIPRAFAAGIEILLVWSDVILVAIFLGPSDAGVYAIASRFITAGTLGENALRISLAPRFSALFSNGQQTLVSELLTAAKPVMVVLTWPIFLGSAIFAAAVLGIFGTGFETGIPVLALLSCTMLIISVLGPVQSTLLMSGRTSAQLWNKVVALVVQVGLNLILLPTVGLIGAGIAWSASMLVDNLLAAVELHILENVRPAWRGTVITCGVLAVAGIVAYAIVSLLQVSGIPSLVVAGVPLGLAMVCLLGMRGSPAAIRGL